MNENNKVKLEAFVWYIVFAIVLFISFAVFLYLLNNIVTLN